MQLQEIDSITALQQEKQRLQQEVNAAKQFLTQKTQQSIWNVKASVRKQLSWPNLLQSGLKLGLGAVAANSINSTEPNSPNWLKGLQEGLAIADSEDPQKWIKLLPIALELWQNGMSPTE